jgi:rhodanese-related sulfurtransferase
MRMLRTLSTLLLCLALLATACGGDTSEPGELRLVSVQEGAAIQAEPPSDLVILDVRTPEEFAEGHLDGAVMIDFYDLDFADQLAELDPDVPYLLYCRSGNRSGQTLAIMEELGFSDVADVDGGINQWQAAGLPVVAP